jgi:phosphoenolpyruvate carboxykinase (ATP)
MNHQNEPLIRAQLARLGLRWVNCIYWNENPAELMQQALERREGQLSASGTLAVKTGTHTGRSPNDKYVVRNAASSSLWQDKIQTLSPDHFERLKSDMAAHARLKSLFVQDLTAGADETYAMPTRVITEHAWQALFIRNLLRSTSKAEPQLTILCLPSFKADTTRHGTRCDVVIAIDLAQKLVLIGGTHYAGEIKKAVFTVMNHILPERGVLPMHCAANVDDHGKLALFFGLSGTGKTTLSADHARKLIGDDEHGWSSHGVFNIEGGCYAKAINLSAEREPEIFAAAHHFGTVLENVVMDDQANPDFNDVSLTQNTRIAYPLSSLNNVEASGRGAAPSAIIMLTCDAFGVLPPIASLSPERAMDMFMAGYTAKVAGTESGVREPEATFSACFGAPFLTRHPQVYGDMLRRLMIANKVPCYLINTGWSGGAYGVGQRISLSVTRKLVTHALSGAVDAAPQRHDAMFGLSVPTRLPGIPPNLLNPRDAWADGEAYDATAQRLKTQFDQVIESFAQAERLAAE